MLRSAASPPGMVTLVLLTALTVLSLTMFLPSLSNMAQEFGTDYALVSLSVSAYLAGTAIMQLIMGPLSDRYGRRPVLLAGLAIFVLASLGCTLAGDIRTFLGFRILQATIISGYALSCAIIRDTSPEPEAASLLGYVGMAMAIGPILGPMFGGVLDELFGWRASFLTYIGLGTALFVLCWIDLGETNENPAETFGEQFRAYPALLRSARFWGHALCMAFSTAAFYAFLSGAPLVAHAVLDLSPATLGICMGSITVGFFLGSFLSGRYARRHALTTMMIAGRVVACGGLCLGLALFLAGIVNEVTLFGATACAGIGNGLTMPSSNVGAMSVRPDLAGSAAGLSGALLLGVGAILSSVTGAILTQENAARELLGVMLFCSSVALLAALLVRRIDRREGYEYQMQTCNHRESL